MVSRLNIASGSAWEDEVGYSRAVRLGNVVEVSGTTASKGNDVIGVNDLYQQTVFILQKIKIALEQCGAGLEDVVRTRMYGTDISNWRQAAKAHSEFFEV